MKYKKVVCIYPYDKVLPYYGFFPPIGIEYIAAAIQDIVQEVCVIDLRYEKDFRTIVNGDVDMFCVSVGWQYEIDQVCEVIRSLPKGVMTVVGGKYATENAAEMFRVCPNIDVIVRGDGEETIRELVQVGTPQGVTGLSYRNGADIVHNKNRLLGPVSDTLFPDRKLRRYPYQIGYKKSGTGYGFDVMISSRGCPFSCKFCSFNFDPMGQKRPWSARTPESVVDELRKTSARVVMFIDENFFADIKRAEEICDLIIKEKQNRIFFGQARVSIGLHPELVRKMYLAGFRLIMMGLESAQDKTLKQLQKGFTTAEVRKAFEVLRNSKIVIHAYFIVGSIGETEQEMLEIAPFAREIGVDTIALSRLRYEKYSALEEVLANNKDYYVDEKDFILSKQYGKKDINRICTQIRHGFFDFNKIVSLGMKAIRIHFPPWSFIWRFAAAYLKEEVTSRLKGKSK